MTPTHIAVLALDGASLFHLTLPALVFGAVPSHAYAVDVCAPVPGLIRTDTGLEIRVEHGLEALETATIIIVPAWGDPGRAAPAVLTEALRRAHDAGKLIVGLCQGAFVLGDAGLLDGRQATTHWAARDAFAARFPNAKFRPDVLYIEEDNIVTSAGNVAAIDCCLNLIRSRHGADIANRAARMLVTPPHRQGGQAQYIEQPVPVLPCQSKLPHVLEWALEHLSEPLNVDALARQANMSRRSFTRNFREATGLTVTGWLTAQRVARAQQLLETTDLPVERIAYEVGFGTPLSLRLRFAEHVGTSPSAYRASFGGAG
ncbi:GlxA family transcriptional regulator [Falsirhodobacter sp. 1013]|uniref:GlxA family transcriptional regulator n=1 Tax=Falsirhodobacter sp. 1013 TaxID=3417566 RepID=UPI003EC0465F